MDRCDAAGQDVRHESGRSILGLGTSVVCDIAEVVDPQPHVVAKVPKLVIEGLKKAPV